MLTLVPSEVVGVSLNFSLIYLWIASLVNVTIYYFGIKSSQIIKKQRFMIHFLMSVHISKFPPLMLLLDKNLYPFPHGFSPED